MNRMPNHAAIAAAARPWYRDRWPWLLMAGPIIVVCAGFATAWLAWSTDDGVVADDYYKRGLVINRELERASRGEMLRLSAVLTIAPDGGVRVELSGAAGMEVPGAVRARFANATRAGLDRTATLARAADGTYSGRIVPLPPGRWLVAVETEAWRVPAVEVDGGGGEVRMGAARGHD